MLGGDEISKLAVSDGNKMEKIAQATMSARATDIMLLQTYFN